MAATVLSRCRYGGNRFSGTKCGVLSSYVNFFLEFQILESKFRFVNFSTAEFKNKFQPESLESKMESEFRFRWGSQKSEPKIGIPNQAFDRVTLGTVPCLVSPLSTDVTIKLE
jgi:hypothetical protein